MHRLSDDLVRVIGYYLEGDDFFSFQAVTSRFRKVLRRDLWANLTLEPAGSTSTVSSYNRKPVLRLRYRRCNSQPWFFTDDHTCLTRMIKLPYEHVQDGVFDPESSKDGLSCVKFLSIRGVRMERIDDIVQTLEKLRKYLKQLKYVEFRGGAEINPTILHALAEFPSLQEIKVDNLPHILPSTVVDVGGPPKPIAPRITALCLCYDTEIYNDRALVENLGALKNVVRLALYYSSSEVQNNRAFFDAQRLAEIMRNFPRLKRLETTAPIFNPQGITWLPDSVESLVVSGATGLDDVISDNGRHLRELTVYAPLTETTFQGYNLQSLQSLELISPHFSPDPTQWEAIFDALTASPLTSLNITVPDITSFIATLQLRHADTVFAYHLHSLRLNYSAPPLIPTLIQSVGLYLRRLEFLLLDLRPEPGLPSSHVLDMLDLFIGSSPNLSHLYMSYANTLTLFDITHCNLVDYYGHRILDPRDDAHFCNYNPIYSMDVQKLRELRNIPPPDLDD